MGLVRFVGKFLIVASILFQAFLLYQDKKEGDEFNRNLKVALASCECLASIKPYLLQYLRLVIVGLLGFSAFMIVIRFWGIKLLTLTGLFLLLWVEHHGSLCKVPTIALLDNAALWHSLGVIGAILYLMADECKGCKKGKKEKESERSEGKSEGRAEKAEPKEKKGKSKKQ